jgi:hypothetical protein
MVERAQETATLGECGHAACSSLRLRSELSFEDWVRAGRHISKVSSASAWWLGDWLLYGEQAYGRRYRTALEVTPFDYKTLRNYAWVARRFEPSRRRDRLSFQHHAEVASLPEPEQDLWLMRAETLCWSRNELRRRLAARRRDDRDGSDESSLVLRMEIAEARHRRWREAALKAELQLADWIAAAADDAADAALERDDAPAVDERQPDRLIPLRFERPRPPGDDDTGAGDAAPAAAHARG